MNTSSELLIKKSAQKAVNQIALTVENCESLQERVEFIWQIKELDYRFLRFFARNMELDADEYEIEQLAKFFFDFVKVYAQKQRGLDEEAYVAEFEKEIFKVINRKNLKNLEKKEALIKFLENNIKDLINVVSMDKLKNNEALFDGLKSINTEEEIESLYIFDDWENYFDEEEEPEEKHDLVSYHREINNFFYRLEMNLKNVYIDCIKLNFFKFDDVIFKEKIKQLYGIGIDAVLEYLDNLELSLDYLKPNVNFEHYFEFMKRIEEELEKLDYIKEEKEDRWQFELEQRANVVEKVKKNVEKKHKTNKTNKIKKKNLKKDSTKKNNTKKSIKNKKNKK